MINDGADWLHMGEWGLTWRRSKGGQGCIVGARQYDIVLVYDEHWADLPVAAALERAMADGAHLALLSFTSQTDALVEQRSAFSA